MPHSVDSPLGPHDPEAKDTSTHYWNANRPRELWTEECPEFLAGVSQKNVGILSKKDEEFQRYTWPHVQEIVGTCEALLFIFHSAAQHGWLTADGWKRAADDMY